MWLNVYHYTYTWSKRMGLQMYILVCQNVSNELLKLFCMGVLESRLCKGLEADWDLGGPTAQQRTQHVCWMILGTQLLVKHQFFRGRLLLALVASGKLCWGIGNQKCPSKFFFWYPYTLSVYDCDNMLWLHGIKICINDYDWLCTYTGEFVSATLFFTSWLLVQRRFTCKHPCSGNGHIYKWKCLCAGGTAVLFRVWLFAFSFLWLLPSISRFHSHSTTVAGPLAYLCSAPIMHHLAMLCKRQQLPNLSYSTVTHQRMEEQWQ